MDLSDPTHGYASRTHRWHVFAFGARLIPLAVCVPSSVFFGWTHIVPGQTHSLYLGRVAAAGSNRAFRAQTIVDRGSRACRATG